MTHDIDTRLRTTWHESGDALTPGLQGRLRAARRTALSSTAVSGGRQATTHGRAAWIAVPATALAALFAVAVLVPRGDEAPVAPVVAMETGASVGNDTGPPVAATIDTLEVLTLEDDPDFYLWLASDETTASAREVTREPI